MTTKDRLIDRLSHLLISMPNLCAQTVSDTIDFLYNERTADDMLFALNVVADMECEDIHRYFGYDVNNSLEGLYKVIESASADDIFKAVDAYIDGYLRRKLTCN